MFLAFVFFRLRLTEERYRREFSTRTRLESDFRVSFYFLFYETTGMIKNVKSTLLFSCYK